MAVLRFAALLAWLALGLPGTVLAAELQVHAAGAVQSVLLETGALFERDSGHKLKFAFGTVGALRDRITGGEAADVTVLSTPAMVELDRRTLLSAQPRSVIGTVGSGIAIRKGAPKPKIGTPEELKETMLAAKSISYGDPARGATSGIHFAGILKQLGIAEAMQPKTFLVPFGVEAIERVAKGDSEYAVSQASEILANPGVELAGSLPPALQSSTTYTAAPLAKATQSEAAAAYVRFIASAPVIARFRALGFAAP
jgi:molybdate transport system substrate-binding protein